MQALIYCFIWQISITKKNKEQFFYSNVYGTHLKENKQCILIKYLKDARVNIQNNIYTYGTDKNIWKY